MLQLKMGRLAHVIGIGSGLALAFTALISYGLINWDFLRGEEWLVTLKWFIPLITGVAVAAVALAIKWEPYLADREQPHFIMSIIALVAPLFIITLIVLDEYDYVQLGRPAWLYSASLMGICFTEISLAMTWEGTGRRKLLSITAAIFPMVLLVFPMLFDFEDWELAAILPMAYLGSAVAIQLSGSMLHIIASSTSLLQREVLRASDSKLKEQFTELDKKRAALSYREDALRSRESDLETYEKRLMDEMNSIEAKKQQMAAMELEANTRLDLLRVDRERLAKNQAELENQRDTLQMKLSSIESQKREIEKRSKAISAKEDSISRREIESNKLLLDASFKEKGLRNSISELEAQAKEIEDTRKELDAMQAALADREKQLGMRESQLDMKGMEVATAKEQLGKVAKEKTAVQSLQDQLLARQESLAQREIKLKATEDEIRQKAEKAERLMARADKQLSELVEKENVVITREKSLMDKESELRGELEGLNVRLADMESEKIVIGDREKQYQDLTEATRVKMSSVAVQEDEISRKMTALEKREVKIKELESRLKGEHEQMNSKLRQLLEKEKDLKAQEAEIGLKHAELRAMEQEVLESAEEVEEARSGYELPEEEDEREKTFEFREKRLVEKEQEIKSKYYQREKELERRETALRAHLQKDVEEMEGAVEEEYAVEKIKTGVERLDDLLMGGMPFGSNTLYVGPPFIGKEVGMLLFAAEGLRKGVPVIIVTTSKTPKEISKDFAPILPTFMEFENLGLVHWIDASGMPLDPQGPTTNVHSVPKPGDLAGVQKEIDACVKVIQKQKHPYLRLIYMSLSMSITQTDEKSAFAFVQGLAGRLKQGGAVSVYAVERGMHTEQQLESNQHHMSGAVQFKTDMQKTLLSVQGIGDAQTRAWIEYRHTNKALMIGAFSLERIR